LLRRIDSSSGSGALVNVDVDVDDDEVDDDEVEDVEVEDVEVVDGAEEVDEVSVSHGGVTITETPRLWSWRSLRRR